MPEEHCALNFRGQRGTPRGSQNYHRYAGIEQRFKDYASCTKVSNICCYELCCFMFSADTRDVVILSSGSNIIDMHEANVMALLKRIQGGGKLGPQILIKDNSHAASGARSNSSA